MYNIDLLWGQKAPDEVQREHWHGYLCCSNDHCHKYIVLPVPQVPQGSRPHAAATPRSPQAASTHPPRRLHAAPTPPPPPLPRRCSSPSLQPHAATLGEVTLSEECFGELEQVAGQKVLTLENFEITLESLAIMSWQLYINSPAPVPYEWNFIDCSRVELLTGWISSRILPFSKLNSWLMPKAAGHTGTETAQQNCQSPSCRHLCFERIRKIYCIVRKEYEKSVV